MLSVLAALLLGPSRLLVGSADVDISPPELLPLGGYTERHGELMKPGGDKLHARVLFVRAGLVRTAIVSVETLTIPESLVRDVQKLTPKGIHLLICATHTHCAPDSQMLNDRMTFMIPGIATYKRRWLRWYAHKIAFAIAAAVRAAPHAVDEIRVETWQADLNRGRRQAAAPDKTATLVEASERRPLLFEYAAHSTFYDADEDKTRGDWPGQVTRIAPMAVIGPIGDVSPKAPGLDHAPAARKIAAFWKVMIRERRSARRTTDWRSGQPVSWVAEPIQLGPPIPQPEFRPRALAKILVKRFAPPTASISLLRLGALVVVGVPGEPTSEIGRRIAHAGRAMGFRHVLVLSHCNGWMGYILGSRDYEAGGYEASLSFYGRDGGNRVVQAAARALKRAWG